MTKRCPGTSSLNLYGPAPMGYFRSAVSAPYFSYTARFVMMSRSKMYSGSGAVGCLVVKRTVYLSTADAEAIGAMFCPCLLCGSLRTRLKECTTSSAVNGEPSCHLMSFLRWKIQLFGSFTSHRSEEHTSELQS